jgi:hypothetical protein
MILIRRWFESGELFYLILFPCVFSFYIIDTGSRRLSILH